MTTTNYLQADPAPDVEQEIAALRSQIAAATALGLAAKAVTLTAEINARVRSLLANPGTAYSIVDDFIAVRRWATGASYILSLTELAVALSGAGLAAVLPAVKDASINGRIAAPTVTDYVLTLKVPFAVTLTEFAAKTRSGTCTAKLTIDGVDVTGSSTAFSAVEAAGTCSAANVAAAGTTIAIVITAIAAPIDFAFTIKANLS